MRQYLDLMERVLAEGVESATAPASVPARIFGHQMRFDLTQGSRWSPPRSCTSKSIVYECCGSCAATLTSNISTTTGVRIWDEWADENTATSARSMAGNGGRGRRPTAAPIDQLANVVADIRRNPNSRRLVVSAWNRGDRGHALPPCHCCSSSTSPTGVVRASSISARPTCFSACRLTSPPTRC